MKVLPSAHQRLVRQRADALELPADEVESHRCSGKVGNGGSIHDAVDAKEFRQGHDQRQQEEKLKVMEMSIPVFALPMELKKLPVMGWMELMQVIAI